MKNEFTLPRRRRRIRPYLDLVPMIDTVFTLLLFFAVAIMIAGPRSAIPVNLPKAQSTQRIQERVVLMLSVGKPIQVNGKDTTIQALGAELKKVSAGNLDTQVVVLADRKVPYSDLVAALDETRMAGFHRIALGASPKKPVNT
jgi:biopolymer transport protein ExbD